MYENPDGNRQIHAKCLPFFKISSIYAWKITLFSWFREFAPTYEKLPLSSRKWVRAWYTFWSGVGEPGHIFKRRCCCSYNVNSKLNIFKKQKQTKQNKKQTKNYLPFVTSTKQVRPLELVTFLHTASLYLAFYWHGSFCGYEQFK